MAVRSVYQTSQYTSRSQPGRSSSTDYVAGNEIFVSRGDSLSFRVTPENVIQVPKDRHTREVDMLPAFAPSADIPKRFGYITKDVFVSKRGRFKFDYCITYNALAIDALRDNPPKSFAEFSKTLITPSQSTSLPKSELGLSGDFVPSKKLLSIWLAGLNNYIAEAESFGPGNYSWAEIPSDSAFQSREFTKRIHETVAKMAVMLAYKKRNIYRLEVAGRNVSPTFSSKIVERLIVPATRSNAFITLLYTELREWLRAGRVFEGAWGRLEVDEGGDLLLFASKPKPYKTRGFVASDED